jgi:uncharacterized repeat protein (TIGR03803 family)
VALFAQIPGPASASSFQVLYSFCAADQCADGSSPYTNPLIIGPTGTLYGTTQLGGDADWGTVFAMIPNGKKTSYKYKRLYSFCSVGADCDDGFVPATGVISDTSGNLYGTTLYSSNGHKGQVFKLDLSGKKPELQTLYSFCVDEKCSDGAAPAYYDHLTYAGAAEGLPYDGKSALYGTTPYGGAYNEGVAFSLTPGVHGWKERVLYNFGGSQGYIATGVLLDSAGNLFGTTTEGGANDEGVIFELSPAKKGWKETVLYNLCGQPKCQDGANPSGPLLMDAAGNLFGGATNGGAHNDGALFKLVPNGKSSRYSVIYSFCSIAKCADGEYPYGDLAIDEAGDIYGTSSYGAESGGFGVFYRLHGSTLQVLHAFCTDDTCGDGASPLNGVIRDATGHLLGMTNLRGGNGQGGTVYEIMP